ncbi:hypothetical protein [Aureivirga sp. CE67]|uniref:hypothetical protein n=1 Tax=Aureivirga sp. CE67 TaxID=1788983 RepID=UPI0018CA79B1|nr:hypothetical protein [Aureivirga sp. CE67]
MKKLLLLISLFTIFSCKNSNILEKPFLSPEDYKQEISRLRYETSIDDFYPN